MNDEIEQLLADFNPGHDHIQLQYFVVGQGITDYGKFHQAQAELWSRSKEINRLKRELKKREIQIDNLKYSDADPRLIALDKETWEEEISEIQKALDKTEHEIAIILPLARTYAKAIEGKDKSQLIEEYQFERLKKQLMINTIFHGGNLSGVADTIMTLPQDMQERLLLEYREMNIKLLKDYREWEGQATLLGEKKEHE